MTAPLLLLVTLLTINSVVGDFGDHSLYRPVFENYRWINETHLSTDVTFHGFTGLSQTATYFSDKIPMTIKGEKIYWSFGFRFPSVADSPDQGLWITLSQIPVIPKPLPDFYFEMRMTFNNTKNTQSIRTVQILLGNSNWTTKVLNNKMLRNPELGWYDVENNVFSFNLQIIVYTVD